MTSRCTDGGAGRKGLRHFAAAERERQISERPNAPSNLSADPQYFIEDGIHRAVAIRENGGTTIPARLFFRGSSPRILIVRLDHLHSPRATIQRSDPRHKYDALEAAMADPKIRAKMKPIDIQPLGDAGQPASVPLSQS
jgi:hypothetical protein